MCQVKCKVLYVYSCLIVTNKLPKEPGEYLCYIVPQEKKGHKLISEMSLSSVYVALLEFISYPSQR